jgi:hypothetical protein
MLMLCYGLLFLACLSSFSLYGCAFCRLLYGCDDLNFTRAGVMGYVMGWGVGCMMLASVLLCGCWVWEGCVWVAPLSSLVEALPNLVYDGCGL